MGHKLNVRVVCLARLNILARAVARIRKTEKYVENASFGCSQNFAPKIRELQAFHRKCRQLAKERETRVLWLPYEAAKDGSPKQNETLVALQLFLDLDPPRPLVATTRSFEPLATDHHLDDAPKCKANLQRIEPARCADTFLAMLSDPSWPYQ